MIAAHILAALLLPPLAVFLTQGLSRNFWIAIALTCLGFLPGIVFALYVVLNAARSPAPQAA